MFLEIFPCGPFQTNAILLGCSQTKKAVLIDAPFGCCAHFLEVLEKNGLQAEKILLTHSHWDHIAEVALLKKELHIPVYIHAADAQNLQKPGSDGLPLLYSIEGASADGFLSDGEKITVGTLELTVMHTPGHSPGCVCFYLEKQKVLISGDTLFCGTHGNLSFPSSQPELMAHSLKKLAALPPDTQVFPGHGRSTTIGAEEWIRRSLA